MPKHQKHSKNHANSSAQLTSTSVSVSATVELAITEEAVSYVVYPNTECKQGTQLLTFPKIKGIAPQILLDICRLYISESKILHKDFTDSEMAPTIQAITTLPKSDAQMYKFASAAFTAAGSAIADINPKKSVECYHASIQHLCSAIDSDKSYANDITYANIFAKTLSSMDSAVTSIPPGLLTLCHKISNKLNAAAQAKHNDNPDLVHVTITINQKLALLYTHTNDYDGAIKYFVKALEFAPQKSLVQANIEHEIGLLYCLKGEDKNALPHFETEAKIIMPGIKPSHKLNYIELAQCYFDNALYVHAAHLAKKALLGDCVTTYDICSMLNLLASSYLQLGHLSKTYNYIKEAISLQEAEGLLIQNLVKQSTSWDEVIKDNQSNLVQKLIMFEQCLYTLSKIRPNEYLTDPANPLQIKIEDIRDIFNILDKYVSSSIKALPKDSTNITQSQFDDKNSKKYRKQEEEIKNHKEAVEFLEGYHNFTNTKHNCYVDFDTYLYGRVPMEQRNQMLEKLISMTDIIRIYLSLGDVEHAKQYHSKFQELQRDLGGYIKSQMEAHEYLSQMEAYEYLVKYPNTAQDEDKEKLIYYTKLSNLVQENQRILGVQKEIIESAPKKQMLQDIATMRSKASIEAKIGDTILVCIKYMLEGSYDKALKFYNSILSDERIESCHKAQIYIGIGKAYIVKYTNTKESISLDDIDQFIKIITKYIDYTTKDFPQYNYVQPVLQAQLGEAYSLKKKYFASCMKELSTLDFDTPKTKANILRASSERAQALQEETRNLSLALNAFKSTTKGIISTAELNAQKVLGEALYEVGQYGEALNLFLEICEMSKKVDYYPQLLESIDYNKVAKVYSHMNEMEKSKQYYREEIKILQEMINDETGLAPEQNQAKAFLVSSYHDIANIYTHLKQYPEAIGYYKAELSLLDPTTKEFEIADIYNTLGRVYYLSSRYQDCIDALEKWLPAMNLVGVASTDFRDNVLFSYMYLSNSYIRIENPNHIKAQGYALESGKHTHNISLFLGHSFCTRAEAATDLVIKNTMYSVALGHYNKSFTNFTKVLPDAEAQFVLMARQKILEICGYFVDSSALEQDYNKMHKYAQQGLSIQSIEDTRALLGAKYNFVKNYLTKASSPEAAVALGSYSQQKLLFENLKNITTMVVESTLISEQEKSTLFDLYAQYCRAMEAKEDAELYAMLASAVLENPEDPQGDSISLKEIEDTIFADYFEVPHPEATQTQATGEL